jgi:serine/threonine protein phosphatase PrpC
MGWRSLSRSVIGTRHLRHCLPCQDAGGYRVLGDLIIGAVADGAGSAPYSERGATIAVQQTLNYLSNLNQWLQPSANPQWPTIEQAPSTAQTKRLFERAVNRVRQHLQQQAEQDSYGVDAFACTLLAFAATPHWLVAMQIGDGFMVASTEAESYQLLFQPDKGEYVNQTAFVTTSTALTDLQTRVLATAPQFICAATDAFEHLAMRLPKWEPHPPFFEPLKEYLWETPDPEQDDTYIMDFLTSDYLNKQTDDDKTLLLCYAEAGEVK